LIKAYKEKEKGVCRKEEEVDLEELASTEREKKKKGAKCWKR